MWQDFPHQGYVDLQFYHLAADHALDVTAFRTPPRVPILLPGLDAPVYLLDYLVELELGGGRSIASSLRFWGEQAIR